LNAQWWDGDPAAFGRLVSQWQERVAGFLVRLVGDAETTQDLTQEVFLRVYLARRRYQERGALSTWLFQIALNVARDALRRRRPVHLHDSEQAANVPAADETCEQQELIGILNQAVALLPQPLREVLVLRHYENMTFEDMSRLLDEPASTLKSRFTAALKRLRLHLKERGYTHEEIH